MSSGITKEYRVLWLNSAGEGCWRDVTAASAEEAAWRVAIEEASSSISLESVREIPQ